MKELDEVTDQPRIPLCTAAKQPLILGTLLQD